MYAPDGIRRLRFAEVDCAGEVDGLKKQGLDGVWALSRVSAVEGANSLLDP